MAEKDEWKKFIKKLLSRKRSYRKYTIPRDYVIAVADNIHSANPTLEILINTLSDFYSIAFRRGWDACLESLKFRKQKRDKHMKDDWNKVKDALDDEIHQKNK